LCWTTVRSPISAGHSDAIYFPFCSKDFINASTIWSTLKLAGRWLGG
jgi:hypothetical protein